MADAPRVDIVKGRVHTGEDTIIAVPVRQADRVSKQSMLGWILKWELRLNAADANPLVTRSSPIITLGDSDPADPGTNDVAKIPFYATDSYDAGLNTIILNGLYHHSLWRYDSGGNHRPLAWGDFWITAVGAR